MILTPRALLVLATSLTFAAIGCGDDDTGDGSDSGMDSGTGRMDSGTRPRPDAGPGADAGDAGPDAGALSIGVTCEEADVADADSVLGADVRADTTFRGLIHVTTAIDVVNDANVTIEPGTTFIMDADTDIEFGWNNNSVTVSAVGTEELPIRFCAKVDQPGYYGGVVTGSAVTSDSVLEHVIISNAGSEDFALSTAGSLRVAHVQVDDSGAGGVRVARFATGSTDLSVRRAAGIAVVITDEAGVTSFPLGGDFEDNEDNSAHLRFTDIDTADTTFKALPIPYVQEERMDIHDVKVTFEAGVDYRFAADTYLEVGWNFNQAELLVEGEEGSPVTFQGVMPTKGYYHGIRVRGSVRSSSKIEHARILHGGGVSEYALEVEARIALNDVELEDNARGAAISTALQTSSANLSITGTDDVPLTVNCEALTTLPTGGTFTGNTDDEVLIDDCGVTTVAGMIPDLGVPYHLLENMELDDGSDVEIEPGTEFVIASDVQIIVGWNFNMARLSAVGTMTEPIVFTGEQDTAGYWESLVFPGNALSTSALDYVTISGAGQPGSAALILERAIPVTNTTIRNSTGAGIQKEAADTTDYTTGGNTFMNVAQGSVIDG